MFPARASHPPSCRVCQGTGWQDGPPIVETVNGRQHLYATVTPCTHHWTDDEPDWHLIARTP